MATVITSNMLLTVPVVGQEPGPDWASDLNNCMTIIDQHDHSSGSGVQITPSGLNINSTLSMNGNILADSTAIEFDAVSSLSTNLALYVIGNEIYYRDGAGNQVQITNGGSVNAGAGSITGLPSGTASVVYTALNQTYTFQSATNTAANIDAGSVLLRNLSPNSTFAVELDPPAALGSNYTITLPTLPASKKIVTMSAAGVLAADYDVDNVTLDVSGNNLEVKDGGISYAKMSAVNAGLSNSSNNFSTGSTSYANVTNSGTPISAAFTASGHPVQIMLIPDGTGASFLRASATTANPLSTVAILRDAAIISEHNLGSLLTAAITAQGVGSISSQGTNNGSGSPVANVGITAGANSGITWGQSNANIVVPPGTISMIDFPAAGSRTYTVQVKVVTGTSIEVVKCKLYAYEIR